MENGNQYGYSFSHRFKGDIDISLFDKYYLKVNEKKLKKERAFKLELAMLNPKPIHIKGNALHWLAAAILSGLADSYLLYYLITTGGGEELSNTLLAIATLTLLAAGFVGLYLYTFERKWVLETRVSLYPLIQIPYRKRDKERAEKFVAELQAAIQRNLRDKDYNADTLFAGEMRMLRRLAKNNILSTATYDKAKKHMLENSSQTRAA